MKHDALSSRLPFHSTASPVTMPLSARFAALQELTPQQWLERALRHLPQAVIVLLVIAIAWQLVQLLWMTLQRPAALDAAPIPAAVAAAPAPTQGVDIPAIINAHLFGVVEAPPPPDVTNAPQTQMNLLLSAVFASSDPQRGLAIIGETAQNTKVYAVGAGVRQGTRLHSVYHDRVLLDRGGALESLSLPKPNTAGLQINRPTPRAPAAAAPAPAPAPPQGNGAAIDSLRQIAETNPNAFSQVVRQQPVFANGVQRGFRVYPGRDRQMFTKLGLEPGDLVLAINGSPLDDPQRALEVFNTMASADSVALSLERNGQPQELTVDMTQLHSLAQAGVAPAATDDPGQTGEPPQQ